MERETGVEPATSSLGSLHSTTELLPPLRRPGLFRAEGDFSSGKFPILGKTPFHFSNDRKKRLAIFPGFGNT